MAEGDTIHHAGVDLIATPAARLVGAGLVGRSGTLVPARGQGGDDRTTCWGQGFRR